MELIIILVYLGVTLLQALSCYIGKQWIRESKHVDYKHVCETIKQRIQEVHSKREEGLLFSPEKEEQKLSNDSDNSDDSNGI